MKAASFALAIAISLAGRLGVAGTVAPFGPATYSVASAVRAHGVPPAHQFSFLAGRWRVEQLLPALTDAQRTAVIREDWVVQPDGSLVGTSYTEGDPDPKARIEIRLLIKHDRYFHTLKGGSFTAGQLLEMPVVQASPIAFASVNENSHAPVRTNYDLLPDGSISASIYLAGDRQVSVYHMTRYVEGQ